MFAGCAQVHSICWSCFNLYSRYVVVRVCVCPGYVQRVVYLKATKLSVLFSTIQLGMLGGGCVNCSGTAVLVLVCHLKPLQPAVGTHVITAGKLLYCNVNTMPELMVLL